MSSADSDERFRESVRCWLEESCPPSMRTPMGGEEDEVWGGSRGGFASPDQRLWLERMASRGFTAPTWPVEYGGAGLAPARAGILEEELRRLGCRPPLHSLGLWMLGPVLLRFGSEEQKRRHLPPIARGAVRWCQGYSEPEAGSDLAGVKTRAVLEGDHYVVSGQKLWTSHAAVSDGMFCLVRTGADSSRHEGLGFLLVDLSSPGVDVRPIRLISGESPFCETFFDDVRVPVENLVGQPGQGWKIAMSLLEFERAWISRLGDADFAREEPLEVLARRYLGEECGRLSDAVLRDRIAQLDMDRLCNASAVRHAVEALEAGRGLGPESSALKLQAMELRQRWRELKVELAGFQGLGWEGPGFSAEELRLTRDWLRSRANSIEGGTSEIHLNIIAKRVLGLPD
ncbi:acyl-CoA dehydrogenase [Myxococcus stipitatus DSM 14675]|uniref:Acyl-CoA dehydrogenase n=1 Tax=Myxococcus stipitatus (strain DSM 14675 / JCM 12634 / Mx s8) TaxID=1278073 RepID=L7UE37_MYXSD|nr:acyl-CoA dehydrogenase family protein [Myxococcus stipitatus]AGC46120.1 acyl-CoA dehydrogenase [Myxococcus stipitatus DSM 14675]